MASNENPLTDTCPMTIPIVIQLQELASDSDHGIVDLLRKALVVAAKLDLNDFRAWIQYELNGYTDSGTLPSYRVINGDLRAQNPYHGLIPFIIEDAELQVALKKIHVSESVSSIESLLDTSTTGSICFFFSPGQESVLMRMQGFAAMRPVRVVAPNQLGAILSNVRTAVLEWSLSLEKSGIIGSGYSFSEKERKLAQGDKSIHIQNFQRILGDVTGSTVSQRNTLSIRALDFESLESYLQSKGCTQMEIEALRQAIDKDPKPATASVFGPAVRGWIGEMVGLAASGTWEVSVATAGTLLATAIAQYYGL